MRRSRSKSGIPRGPSKVNRTSNHTKLRHNSDGPTLCRNHAEDALLPMVCRRCVAACRCRGCAGADYTHVRHEGSGSAPISVARCLRTCLARGLRQCSCQLRSMHSVRVHWCGRRAGVLTQQVAFTGSPGGAQQGDAFSQRSTDHQRTHVMTLSDQSATIWGYKLRPPHMLCLLGGGTNPFSLETRWGLAATQN